MGGITYHSNARTTIQIRKDIQQSNESMESLAERYNLNKDTILKWKHRDELTDTIICVNVLEHIEDNVMTLKNMHDIMVEGGKLLLLVPALKLLYGEIDRFHNHYRRYSRFELIDKLNKSGFKIIDNYYMNSTGIFGWFYDTIILRRQEHTSKHVMFFDRFIVPWLSRLERLKRPPIGLSLIVIAEKRL
jgi:SAM-dependent methyltransferase